MGGHCWHDDGSLRQSSTPTPLLATRPAQLMQRWKAIQYEVLPGLGAEAGSLTPELEQVVQVLEWARVEEFVSDSWCGMGRPAHTRAWLANAFVAKAVLGIGTTVGLIGRLMIDRTLRRICGFAPYARLPSAATFSRAFGEFAEAKLGECAHEALIREQLGGCLIVSVQPIHLFSVVKAE